MLETIKELYCKNNKYLCFLHRTNDIRTYCLHFHITKDNKYNRDYNPKQSDLTLLNDIYISNLINLVSINYYNNNYDVSFFRIQ